MSALAEQPRCLLDIERAGIGLTLCIHETAPGLIEHADIRWPSVPWRGRLTSAETARVRDELDASRRLLELDVGDRSARHRFHVQMDLHGPEEARSPVAATDPWCGA